MLKPWQLELEQRASAIHKPETAICRSCGSPTTQLATITDDQFDAATSAVKLEVQLGHITTEVGNLRFKLLMRGDLGCCDACAELEIALLHSSYWRNLHKIERLREKLLRELGFGL